MLDSIKSVLDEEDYQFYLDYLDSADINAEFDKAHEISHQMMDEIPADKHEHRYAEGKFSVKEVFTHIIDCEYEYNEKAIEILTAKGHDLSAHSFGEYDTEENGKKSMEEIKANFDEVRSRTKALYNGMDETMLHTEGELDGYNFTPIAIALFLAGHEIHHHKILRERYL